MYCPECGSKIPSNSNFCEKCGKRIEADEEDTKFCKYCGEKISVNTEICPKCGKRVVNPLRSNSKKTLDGLSRFLKSKYFKILVAVVIILILVYSAPKIIDTITPYKDVDSSYIANPVPFEKVRFTAEYVDETDTNLVGWYEFTTTYDVVKVDDQYVFIRENDIGMTGKLEKGDIIQLEGKFSDGGKVTKEVNNKPVSAYWFAPDSFVILN